MTITELDPSRPTRDFEIRTCPDTGDRALHAARAFEPGATLSAFGARDTLAEPSYLSVQVGPGAHILLSPTHLQYINHSCDPNTFFDTRDFSRHGGRVISLKPIRAGDELTFFYPATEWAMDRPFDCRCRSSRCLGQVQGASQLPAHVLQGYRLSPLIEALKYGPAGRCGQPVDAGNRTRRARPDGGTDSAVRHADSGGDATANVMAANPSLRPWR